jgi:phosphoglycolate phosphatase-like HAD superfamily hydrolase
VSLSRFAKFDHLLELMGRVGDSALRADLAAEFSRQTINRILTVPLVPGAEAFLREVTPRLPVYLASVTPVDDLALILQRRGLARWFRDIYACPPWTKPDAIQDVLGREGAAPMQALLVGDSAGDQRAALLTGVHFLARDSGLGFELPAPLTFPDLSRIAEFIKERLP